jgi:hypothetical protein
MVSMDDNILAAVGCVQSPHHGTYLHQLLLLVTPFVAKEDTIMTTHIRSKRLGKSSLKEEILFLCLSHPPRPQGRRHTRGGIPQGLDCSGRILRKSHSYMDGYL